MFFDILYNILIYPIEFIIEILFYLFNNVFKSSYGVSLFLLSLCINFLSLPLYNIAESWQAKERAIQDKMKPMIDNIKAVYKGDQRYLLIRACQRINGYKTIYAFRGTLGLLIQIPFFMAAYNFVHSLTGLNGQSFLFIKDLSKPDALIHIGNFTINLLPFLMTLFSLLSGFVYSKKLKFKESLPLYVVSLIFLVLLYTSPSGLLFYWTINCLFSLLKNIVIEYKLYADKILCKIYNVLFILLSLAFVILLILNKINTTFLILFSLIATIYIISNSLYLIKKIFFDIKKIIFSKSFIIIYNILIAILSITFVLLLILGNIEREGYLKDFNLIDDNSYNMRIGYYSHVFKNSDVYGVTINKDKLDNRIINIEFGENGSPFGTVKLKDGIDNIDNIKVYYKLFIKTDIIFYFVLLLIICLLLNIRRFINMKLFSFNDLFNNDSFLKNRNKLILLSCFVITLLSGLFIPSSLVSSSPIEFEYANILIFYTMSVSIGLFLFYPLFVYILFSEKIKNIITVISFLVIFIIFVNTFIFTKEYGFISSDFIFHDFYRLTHTNLEVLINLIIIIFIVIVSLIIFIRFKYLNIINFLYILVIVIFSISVFNVYKINIVLHKENNYTSSILDKDDKKNKFNFSKTGKNIFVIILDSALGDYWNDFFSQNIDYRKKFNGFILYPNTVPLGVATLVSTPSLYAGYDYAPYDMSMQQTNILSNWTAESHIMLPTALSKYGYSSSLLSLSYFRNFNNNITNNNIHYFEYDMDLIYNKILTNIGTSKKDINTKNKVNKAIRFSIFRVSPLLIRKFLYQNGNWFIPKRKDINISSSMYEHYKLSEVSNLINIKEDGNYFNILHNDLTHPPVSFNSNYYPTASLIDSFIADKDLERYHNDTNSVMFYYANCDAINIICDLIKILKDNNIYDNTKIIIASDHGSFSFFSKYRYIPVDRNIEFFNSLLIYKDFNSINEFEINTNFMTSGDLAYLAVKHIQGIKNPFNNKLITNDYKTNGVYITFSYDSRIEVQFSNSYNFQLLYYVKNNIFDINNWKKFEIDLKTKKLKEIELK